MTGIRADLKIEVGSKSEEFYKKLLARSMVETQNLAKMYAPKDTGNLMRSIQLEVISDTIIYVTAYASYSRYVEYGIDSRPNYPMQPFMRPALDEVMYKRIKQIAKNIVV